MPLQLRYVLAQGGTRCRIRDIARRPRSVSLWRNGAPLRGHLLDLSATGALCHSDMAVATGDRVLIDAERLGVAGRVVWTGGKRFGLHFDAPLPAPVIARVVQRG